MSTSSDVALILWNPDVIELMSLFLANRNVKSCGLEPSEGLDKIENLIDSQAAKAVVFDLAPPYGPSAAIVRYLVDRFPDLCFVLTCSDPVLAQRAAPWLGCFPLFQKPYEPDQVALTVRSMVVETGSLAAASM
jgi:hypothetical protein